MFAYCENDYINKIDPTGYCYYNTYGYWSHDNWEYAGNYKRKDDPYTKFRNLSKNEKIFVATVCGESDRYGSMAWMMVAWTIVNRARNKSVGEWIRYNTPISVIKNTQFDAYKSKNTPYRSMYSYLKLREKNKNAYKDNSTYKMYEEIIATVMPIYRHYKKKLLENITIYLEEYNYIVLLVVCQIE